jgi:hypothetical protein
VDLSGRHRILCSTDFSLFFFLASKNGIVYTKINNNYY